MIDLIILLDELPWNLFCLTYPKVMRLLIHPVLLLVMIRADPSNVLSIHSFGTLAQGFGVRLVSLPLLR